MLLKLKNTQKLERDAFLKMKLAIEDTQSFYQNKFEEKKTQNLEIRKSYKSPPRFDHLEPHLKKYLEDGKNLEIGKKVYHRSIIP